METLTLAQKEQARLQVLNSLLAEHVSLDWAATLMGVSVRHTRRILAAYRKEGAAALAHGNRGLRSTNATPETLKGKSLSSLSAVQKGAMDSCFYFAMSCSLQSGTYAVMSALKSLPWFGTRRWSSS